MLVARAPRATARRRGTATNQGPAKQSFSICLPDEHDFRSGGLRTHSAYQDLGIAEATGSLVDGKVLCVQARMIR